MGPLEYEAGVLTALLLRTVYFMRRQHEKLYCPLFTGYRPT
jgi:hypothetical protein